MVTPLDTGSVQARLAGAPIGHRILYLPTTTSTMDVARQGAETGAVEGSVVVAEEQTSGRGRFQRPWNSPAGQNLYLSVVLYPHPATFAILSVAAAVACVRGIRRATGLSPTIKWPNDIRLGGKKACGILVESVLQEEGVRYAILGLGLNVNIDPASHPEIAETATSLAHETGRPVSREDTLLAVLEELGDVYHGLQGWAHLWEEWEASLETLGKHVQVQWGDQVDEGVAEGVDPEGNLMLRRSDGTLVTLAAGEVTLQTHTLERDN